MSKAGEALGDDGAILGVLSQIAGVEAIAQGVKRGLTPKKDWKQYKGGICAYLLEMFDAMSEVTTLIDYYMGPEKMDPAFRFMMADPDENVKSITDRYRDKVADAKVEIAAWLAKPGNQEYMQLLPGTST